VIAPKRSPWGAVQNATELAEGIWSVSTAGHGGIKLSPQRSKRVPIVWRRTDGWYEEDCHWAVVAVTFGESAGFTPAHVAAAHKTLKDYYPDAYLRAYPGTMIDIAESYILQKRAAGEDMTGWEYRR